MTTESVISMVRKIAVGSGLMAGGALAAWLVFSTQAIRAKMEYQEYNAHFVQPVQQKWQAAAKKSDDGQKIEPLPPPPMEAFAEENRLAIEMEHLAFRRDVAFNVLLTTGVLSVLLFVYYSVLKKVPIQSSQPTRAAGPRG